MSLKIQEAYLNEWKGNLFEFLVGSLLARKYKIESDYLTSISPNFLTKLKTYEQNLRELRVELLQELAKMAQKTVSELEAYVTSDVVKVELIGKIAKASQDNRYEEADLLLTLKDGFLPISLKLSKHQAFVNTKSAGVKSFLSKYFEAFQKEEDQKEFSKVVDTEFYKMSSKLHANHGLDYCGDYSTWVEEELTELPGELEGEDREALHEFYQSLSSLLHEKILSYSRVSKEKFIDSLYPILGFGKRDILQVICFHSKNKEGVETLKDIVIKDFKNIENVSIETELKNNTNFHIDLDDCRLQLRIKPMNKFTNTSLKVNCSVKYL